MAGPFDFIPKIEGFNPIPVGIMIPFMKAQTAWMMYAGGYNWQFGKRSVDSMSNEVFNARSADYSLVIADQHKVFGEIVSAMNREITEISVVQKDLVDKMVELERMKIEVLPELIGQIPPAFFSGLREYIKGVGPVDGESFTESPGDVSKFRPQPDLPKVPVKKTPVQPVSEPKFPSGGQKIFVVTSLWGNNIEKPTREPFKGMLSKADIQNMINVLINGVKSQTLAYNRNKDGRHLRLASRMRENIKRLKPWLSRF